MLSRVTGERSEDGVTLVELIVVMALMSVVSFISFAALDSSTRTLGNIDDESQGLADLKVVVERLSRDLRAARSVETPTDDNGTPADPSDDTPGDPASALKIWIDADSNYSPSDDELITWRLEAGAGENQFDVIRETDTGDRQVVGTKLVSAIAFSYDPSVSEAQKVTVAMTYDAFPTRNANARVTEFEIRLRNVE